MFPSDHRLIVFGLGLVAVLTCCQKAGKVKVRNEVSKTEMRNVYWGDIYLGGNLFPGEETGWFSVKKSHEHLPASNRIYFTVEGNGNSTSYHTWGVYELEEGGELAVVLTDTTLIVEEE